MKYLFAAVMFILSVTAWAVPALRVKKSIILSDGTQKEVVLMGDENLHFYVDAENNAYTCNQDGVFVRNDLRKLTNEWEERLSQRNRHRLQRAEARGMNLQPRVQSESSIQRRAKWGAESNPISGDKKGLVILVEFSDKSMKSNHGQEFYNGFFNTEGFSEANNRGSVHDYFYECSYGQFNLTFDVYGPVTLSKSYSYYGKNDSSGNDLHPCEMVAEACALVEEMGVDFSKYDWDGDAEVDQVLVVYAGYGEASGASTNTIWPHEFALSLGAQYGDGKGAVTYDGVKIDTYAVTNELTGTSGSTPAGIGVACHEFSHCMCIPDFYDTNTNGTYYGMDAWDLMDYGSYSGSVDGSCPAPYTSYERMYCGWLTPKVLDDPCMVTEMPSLYESPEAYIIYNDRNPNEYYMLENRQSKGFGAYSPSHGLLILHVYFDSKVWTDNTVNNTAIQRMTIIPADNKLSRSTNNADTWPGKTGNTALTDTSTPAAKLYVANIDGRKFMGKPIENIAESDGKISFTFNGGITVDTPFATEPTSVGVDAFTAHWDPVEGAIGYKVQLTIIDMENPKFSLSEVTLMQEDFSKFNNGRTTNGTTDVAQYLDSYTTTSGWSGNRLYSTPNNEVKMSSRSVRGYINTPMLKTESRVVTLSFVARRYNSDKEPLQVVIGKDGNGSNIIAEEDLTSEPKRYIVYANLEGNDFWWGLGCNGRCYISEMSAYDGKVTEEQIENSAITGDDTEVIDVVQTDGTSYQFTGLSNQKNYSYCVCAIYDNVQSDWSNSINVQLLEDEDGIEPTLNSQRSTLNSVYDLQGRKVNSQLKKGIYIVNGKKVLK